MDRDAAETRHELAAEAVRRTDRLWIEPCYSQPQAHRIRETLDLIGPGRMLFGSDSTLIDPAYAIGAMSGTHLDEREERLIMSENARELFTITVDPSTGGHAAPWAR